MHDSCSSPAYTIGILECAGYGLGTTICPYAKSKQRPAKGLLDQQSLAPLNGDRHEKMLVTVAVTIVHREKRPAALGRPSIKPLLPELKSGRPDSNRRRPAWEAGILPTELRPRTALLRNNVAPA